MPERSIAAALVALLLAPTAGLSALAQPASNSLVPGIAPYAPPPPPTSAAQSGTAKTHLEASAAKASSAPPILSNPAGAHDYVLGPGDKLRITVFGEDTLSGEFLVADDGRISFPLIGDIPATGKTVPAVQDEITTALKDGYLKDPRVSAEVLTYRPYFILGEVAKPGQYPYSDEITVVNAVAAAGGFTYRANQKYVLVKRAAEQTERKIRLTDALKLAPGDTVRVMERLF